MADNGGNSGCELNAGVYTNGTMVGWPTYVATEAAPGPAGSNTYPLVYGTLLDAGMWNIAVMVSNVRNDCTICNQNPNCALTVTVFPLPQ
jgi:hypothetical protein